MRRSSPSADVVPPDVDDPERGSAALEFILVGLLLLVPLVYVIVSLGLIQGQALGAEAAVRHIARTVATASSAEEARSRAHVVLEAVTDEYGMDAASVDLSFTCRPKGAECPQAGATLVVTLQTRVALPLVPPVLGLDRLASIPVEAAAAHRVSRFWGSE